MAEKKTAKKKAKSSSKVTKKASKPKTKATKTKKTKSTSKKTNSKKKAKTESYDDMGIVIVDDDLSIDKEKVNEERRAYLEEARSQEAFD